MNEHGKKLRTGAIIMLSLLLSWLVLDLFSQMHFHNRYNSTIPMNLVLNSLILITMAALFLVACCSKKSKVVLIIGAGIGILWYMIQFGADIMAAPYVVSYWAMCVIESFLTLSFMILLLLTALLSERKPMALRKLLCVLLVVAFASSCIRFALNLKYFSLLWYEYILFTEISVSHTSFPWLLFMQEMLQFLAFIWLAGAATRDSAEAVTGSGRGLRIVGLILMGVANTFSIMIATISMSAYNYVCFYNRNEVYEILWTFAFMTLITGGVLLGIGMLLSHKAAVVAPQNGAAMPAQQPVYQQPIYQQPVYQQPVQQPVYQQPIYQQPVYQPPVQQPAQPAPQQKDVFEQLTQLKQMLDMELISQEEYDAKKKQILGL